jgi:tetratricopeptide (TPR) repeat protein
MIFNSDKTSVRGRFELHSRLAWARMSFRYVYPILMLLAVLAVTSPRVMAQRTQILFGDVKVDEGNSGDGPPHKIVVILYRDGAGEVGRQPVSNRSRYRFGDLAKGDYQLAVEVDNNEIARVRVVIEGLSSSPYGYQQDLEFALKPKGSSTRPGVISSADFYNRSSANTSLFQKAQEAVDKKKYEQAVSFLQRVVESDKLDFQAWTLLGTLFVMQDKLADAEKAYQTAIGVKPTFVLALIDLGKLRLTQKRFEEAIEPLTRAIEAQASSADANYLLGEVYLQLKKGSKAIPYLNEAAKLGRSDAHLRLAWLYNAAGLRDKAVMEYEEFLKKKPDYSDRKKLEEYIDANKKN